jgi:hypothetical protein
MTKLSLLILFILSSYNLNADIVSKLLEITEENQIVLYNYSGYYTALYTLSGDNMGGDNYLCVNSFIDPLGPSIMAYTISSDHIRLVIKDRRYAFQTSDTGDFFEEIIYFFVELREVNNKIQYICNKTDQLNLSGFIFNDSFIVNENIEARLDQSLNSATYIILNDSDHPDIDLIEISQEYIKAGIVNDFWYKIKYDNKILWVNGGYVHFGTMIKLPEINPQ